MLVQRMRLQAVVAGLAVAMLGAGCALLAPTAERYAAPPVGTTYARDLRNTGSYGKSMREETRYAGARTWQGRTLLAHERSTGQTSMIDDGGGWVGQFKGDSPIFTFEPSLTVGFPLSVGKTTTKDIRMTVHAQNRVVPFKATWKVEAYEDVTVQAGTFKTFRILYEDELGVRSMSWVDPDTGILIRWKNERSAKHPLGAGTQDAELVSLKLANN